MTNAPMRFVSAALWPLTIWTSLTHFDEHAADDYVGRTSPIIACAVAFWASLAMLAVLLLSMQGRSGAASVEDYRVIYHVFDQRWRPLADVLTFFTPLLYAIGFWLFTARDERFPRSRA